MKIAYLLGSLNRGGTETLMLDMFRSMPSDQLNALCIYRKQGVLEEDFRNTAIRTQKLSPGKNIPAYLIRLRRLIKNHKTDIVHAQQPIDALFAFLACTFLKTKVVLTLHAYDYTETRLSKLILKFVLRKTDLNIYVSDSQKTYYTNKYKLPSNKQKTIYNGIGFEKFNILQSSSIREDLKINSDCLLLGTVGNFVPGRDQLTICKFLDILNLKNIAFHFIFVGKRNAKTPDRYDDCVDFVKENNLLSKVHFLGSRNDVPELLQQLDAFIYSTEHDTFGIAVVEAMACGLPVFVNDWDVMTEITENGKLATLYSTKNQEDLFRQFSLFLHSRQQFVDIANSAKEIVRKKFSITNHISELFNTYSLLNTKK